MTGVYGLMDWQWWVGAVWSGFLIVTVIWWPGWVVLRWVTRWSRQTCAWAASVVGAVLLAVAGYLAGLAGFYNLVYGYVVVMIMSWGWVVIKKKWWWRIGKMGWREIIRKNKVLILLVIVGLVIQLPAVCGSGLRRAEGVHFLFSNYKDGLMHVGFINALSHEWPPLRPEINMPLENYHYFSDLVLAQLVRLGVPSVNLFFQYFPVWWSVVMTGVIYQMMREVTGSRKAACWTTLVFLVASDGAYWLTFFFPHNNGWKMASLDNGVEQFLNVPYVMAKGIFLVAWGLLNHYWQTKRKRVAGLLAGLLVPLTLFKVYWIVLFGSGWAVSLMWRVITKCIRVKNVYKIPKKYWKEVIFELSIMIITGVVSLVLLTSVTSERAGNMAYVPLLWPKLLISSDHLGWTEWELRQQVYAADPSWVREMGDKVLLVIVALVYVYGARLAGLWPGKKARKELGSENMVFLLVPAVGWTWVGFNFLQGVGNYNSFNFLVIASVALLIPLGVNVAEWWESRWGKVLVIVLLGSFAPRMIYGWQEAIRETWGGNGAFISDEQLQFFDQVRAQTRWEELLLVNPDNDYTVAASVYPALAGRRTWVSGRQVLATHDIEVSEREQQARDVLHSGSVAGAMGLARDLGVDWLVIDAWDRENEREYKMSVATMGAIIRVDKLENL